MAAAELLDRCRRIAAERLSDGAPRALPAEDAAFYLAHTALGAPLRRLAAASGRAPSTVLRAVRRVESRRDDPLLDRLVGEIEAAACLPDAFASLAMEAALPTTPNMPSSARTGRPDADAVEKEARRILRRMGEPRAFLAVARGASVAAVFRTAPDDAAGGLVTLARTPIAMAKAFAARDWIECLHSGAGMARYGLSSVGRAWLKRTLVEDGEARRRAAEALPSPFQRQHQAAETRFVPGGEGDDPAGGPKSVNVGETPLGWLARRRGPDGRPFLRMEEIAAGERLREDFEAAQMGPRMAQDWQRFLTAGVSGGVSRGPGEGPAGARARVAAALQALGPGLEDAALRACCFLEGLEATERRMGWSARSGKVVLKIALGRLAEHYGFGRAAVAKRSGQTEAPEAPEASASRSAA